MENHNGITEPSINSTVGMFGRYKNVLTHLPEYSKNVFRKGYWSWLWNQLKGWHKSSYAIMLVNLILQVYIITNTLMSDPSGKMIAAAIFGFIGANLSVCCVLGISNMSGIQGWAGATSALAIMASAALANNWANFTEQIIYLVFLDLFCILDPKWNDNIQAERFAHWYDWIKYTVFLLVMWGIIYYIFGLTNDPNLFWDSLTLAVAFTGSLLELNRKAEQYVFWLVGNCTALILWISSASQGTANYALVVSYSLFFINSLLGANWWFKSSSKK